MQSASVNVSLPTTFPLGNAGLEESKLFCPCEALLFRFDLFPLGRIAHDTAAQL